MIVFFPLYTPWKAIMKQTNTLTVTYPTNLPYDDGEPLETPLHRENMNILIDSAVEVMGEKNDYFVGGNMFLYYNPQEVKNKDFRGPDFFLVKGVDGNKERKSWILWEEDWQYPNIIIELLSESTYQTDLESKRELYEQTFKTSEYFVYDPLSPNNFHGWRLNEYGFYIEQIRNEKDWLWSEELGCWLGVWTGRIKNKQKTYLRMYDMNQNLVLLGFEHAERERMEKEKERMEKERERMEKERERMEKLKLANKLREMGIDPDRL